MNRIIQIILFVVIFPSSVFAMTIANTVFTDVTSNHPYATAITWSQKQGIIEGYSDRTFRPDNTINRAEFVKVLTLYKFGQKMIDQCGSRMQFTDVPYEVWYEKHVCRAKDAHIISGYPDGTFRGETKIVFAEAAKVVINALIGEQEQLRHDDVWHVQYIQQLSQIGAIPETSRGPASLVTRGEMMEMIYKIQKYQGLVVDGQWYCTTDPESTAIGREIFPKKQEYAHLSFLGELFTASECGSERAQKLFGVSDGKYTLKPDIALNADASNELQELLDDIGFECQQTDAEIGKCWHWTLGEIVPVSEILKLKPYASEIKSDGCINCG